MGRFLTLKKWLNNTAGKPCTGIPRQQTFVLKSHLKCTYKIKDVHDVLFEEMADEQERPWGFLAFLCVITKPPGTFIFYLIEKPVMPHI